MIKVALCGSCVTRNSFNRHFTDYHSRYEVVFEHYQTSLVSIMAEPIPTEDLLHGFEGMELRAMRAELIKPLRSRLQLDKPDIVIVDLYTDVMFGIVPFSGSWLTMNRWRLKDKPLLRKLDVSKTITWEHHAMMVAMLRDSCLKFASVVKEEAPQSLLILNSGRAVDRWRSPSGVGPLSDVDHFNATWDAADSIFLKNVSCQVISMPPGIWADGNHPHGCSNVHYEKAYHEAFLSSLDQLCEHSSYRKARLAR